MFNKLVALIRSVGWKRILAALVISSIMLTNVNWHRGEAAEALSFYLKTFLMVVVCFVTGFATVDIATARSNR